MAAGGYISIHALCEEGDTHVSFPCFHARLFLSTPSARRATGRGGHGNSVHRFLSTPSARRATPFTKHYFRQQMQFLSTPSARRATPLKMLSIRVTKDFYPRPLRGGRPEVKKGVNIVFEFLSTPSARRATLNREGTAPLTSISIHALCEEGDRRRRMPTPGQAISIHALCEEGDDYAQEMEAAQEYFYPRPLRGGRPTQATDNLYRVRFLSTPSARRATLVFERYARCEQISIHALCEEGDLHRHDPALHPGISIHALCEEGDRPVPGRRPH